MEREAIEASALFSSLPGSGYFRFLVPRERWTVAL
jgi:hypothetical protein